MIIQSNLSKPAASPRTPSSLTAPTELVLDQVAPTGLPADMTAIDRLREYARQPLETTQPALAKEFATRPPAESQWPTLDNIQSTLSQSATNVPEKVRSGVGAEKADEYIRRQIGKFQQAQAAKEGTTQLNRLVHREQLHGGAAEVHWNPNLNKLINLFDKESMHSLVRISDASGAANPDGKTMYGFALEVYNGDQPTDILMTGGTYRSEASQAKSPEAQLALFNMMNPSSKIGGIGRILWEVGPLDGPKMLVDVARMRTSHESISDITAWSRAPFAVTGKDGKEYLVKMRVVPTRQPETGQASGDTTSAKLKSEFASKLKTGDARWSLDFQFMQPGENAEDPRQVWQGPWIAAAEVVLPKVTDEGEAQRLAAAAEGVQFSPWKGKEPYSQSPDKNVLRPWGELNRGRLAAYQASANNRS
ncbi:hypothetical protein IV102_03560 [bacterium]|nr:hypothetical protein [bacterium]